MLTDSLLHKLCAGLARTSNNSESVQYYRGLLSVLAKVCNIIVRHINSIGEGVESWRGTLSFSK